MFNKINKIMNNNIQFFIDNAYDCDKKVFFSELDNDGKVQNGNIHIIALSRLIYGLMETSSEEKDSKDNRIQLAENAINFIRKNMLGKDKYGIYFIPTVNKEGEILEYSGLNLWEQSYGFNGLVSYYEKTNDMSILSLIHELFDAYILRFHDNEEGGFVFNYSLKDGRDYQSKCLQTIMYPVTSFMGRLSIADKNNTKKYERWIREAYELGAKYLYDKETKSVRVTFDRKFNYSGDSEVLPGHFFQLSWFFTSSRKYIDILGENNYYDLGAKIYKDSMKKAWMIDAFNNGIPESVNPVTDQVVRAKRVWWEHSEWINAMCHLDDVKKHDVEKVLNLFEKMFVDYKKGCEYFAISEKGIPDNKLKGDLGKSSYHTIEMCKFILDKFR